MAIGVSTPSAPFKPCVPSSFWFSSMMPSTTTFSSSPHALYSPKIFHSRRDLHFLRSTNSPSNTTNYNSSNQFKRNSSYSGRAHIMEDIRPRFDKTGFYSSWFQWRLVVEQSSPSSSLARMCPYVRTPLCSKGKVLPYQASPEDIKSICINQSKTQWAEEGKRIKFSALCRIENCSVELAPPEESIVKSEKVESKGLQDGRDYARVGISDSSFWIPDLDNIVGNGQSQRAHQSRVQPSSSGEMVSVKGGGTETLGPPSGYSHSSTSYQSGAKMDSPWQMISHMKQATGKDIKSNGINNVEKVDSTSAESKKPKIDYRKNLTLIYDEVLVVDNILSAKEIVKLLTTQYRDNVHACDTEVAKIDVKQETPVDHGEIICFSIYSGSGVDFGNGKSCIWVDVLDGGGKDLLMEFAPFFEDSSIRKVWHNYSFDSHVIENYGIRISGFHADTMHMARLWDSSRRTLGGYSLEALTSDPKVMSGAKSPKTGDLIGKISMKTIFGKQKLRKDGSEGKLFNIAPVEELQREDRVPWICYSALDSMSTLQLFESMQNKLKGKNWVSNKESRGTMYEFYEEYWRPFGELLVKMETEGMLVDRAYLAEIQKVATLEQQIAADRFRKWASRYCPHALHMNVGSDAQLRQLFFGGMLNSKNPDDSLPLSRTFKVPNVDKVIEEGKKVPSKFRNITLVSLWKHDIKMNTEMFTATGWPSVSGDALKTLAGKVSSEYDWIDDAHGFQSDIDKPLDIPLEDKDDVSSYGTAYEAFGGNKDGKELNQKKNKDGKAACHAIAALCEVCSIDSLISNFILPLQSNNISGKNGRIHCSLNINTETGRLSARRPNLQNQPALEKDRYKIRQAFIAAPGNSLIVADYGQLELRILAHLANCKSMFNAFKAGGDFHSRTAMNMYQHIREAVDRKEVLLEWHPQPGEDKPPVPLLKDAYASERRKAKMLNFSIAYGKTPVGLARDWKVSVKEAKKTVDLWYKDRQEVLRWQEERKQEAHRDKCVKTLLGRTRSFPSLNGASNAHKGHIERAAINTPVQGSAADVAMCAMLEISRNARLKELGWKLLLQVHDEVILEGPTESAEMAKDIVVDCMSKPFDGTNILNVDLAVDAKCAQNWYAAK